MNIIRHVSYYAHEFPNLCVDVSPEGKLHISGVEYMSPYTLEELSTMLDVLDQIRSEIELSEVLASNTDSDEDEGPFQLFFVFDDEEDDSDESL
jgi:hypothetical protein